MYSLLTYFNYKSHYGQVLAPFPNLEGCQRIIEPDLSPLLYNQIPLRKEYLNCAAKI